MHGQSIFFWYVIITQETIVSLSFFQPMCWSWASMSNYIWSSTGCIFWFWYNYNNYAIFWGGSSYFESSIQQAERCLSCARWRGCQKIPCLVISFIISSTPPMIYKFLHSCARGISTTCCYFYLSAPYYLICGALILGFMMGFLMTHLKR